VATSAARLAIQDGRFVKALFIPAIYNNSVRPDGNKDLVHKGPVSFGNCLPLTTFTAYTKGRAVHRGQRGPEVKNPRA